MPKPDTRRLVCQACSHENEVERVYCHNCGEKLDRTLLPKVEEIQTPENQAAEQKRVKQMMSPGRGSVLRQIRTFVLITGLAALVAASFLIFQAPEDPLSAKFEQIPEQNAIDVWKKMISIRPPTRVGIAEYDVNHYLSKSLKSGEGPLGMKFKRAYVTFTPGLIKITVQREIWGLQLYSSVSFKPVQKDGKWAPEVRDLRIGRLGFDPAIPKVSDITLGALAKTFANELKHIDRFSAFDPAQGLISLTTKPAE